MKFQSKRPSSPLLVFIISGLLMAFFGGCATYVAVRTPPPPLPYYDQPMCPGPGYLWCPGYWAYGSEGYYWVPGLWEAAPRAGWLWTPGYWGWSGGAYLWHGGYWGSHVGFYGGVNYGYGYAGSGYAGGYWHNGSFHYNVAVTNVNIAVVHNTYKQAVVNNESTVSRVSYNGGTGGLTVRPTRQEMLAVHEKHAGMTAHQRQHHKAARPARRQP